MPDSEWYLIDSLIGDAAVIIRQLGSKERTDRAIQSLKDNCENQAVIDQIMKLAQNTPHV